MEKSRCPKRHPRKKVDSHLEKVILKLRNERNLGARRLQNELIRLHSTRLSLATIHKVLKRKKAPNLRRKILGRKVVHRYQKNVPGERVQMDVCKIAPSIYQYTAIDDCTRYKVLGIYKRRTAANTLKFLEKAVEEMPFAIQRIQTDRGREFFAYKVQETLMSWGIKFRPIKPRSPHLNGKVERAQQTDLMEFYSLIDLDAPDLKEQLQQWQHDYNWHRPHGALGGKTPMDRVIELSSITPLWEDIEKLYDSSKERIREQNYSHDQRVIQLKQCL